MPATRSGKVSATSAIQPPAKKNSASSNCRANSSTTSGVADAPTGGRGEFSSANTSDPSMHDTRATPNRDTSTNIANTSKTVPTDGDELQATDLPEHSDSDGIVPGEGTADNSISAAASPTVTETATPANGGERVQAVDFPTKNDELAPAADTTGISTDAVATDNSTETANIPPHSNALGPIMDSVDDLKNAKASIPDDRSIHITGPAPVTDDNMSDDAGREMDMDNANAPHDSVSVATHLTDMKRQTPVGNMLTESSALLLQKEEEFVEVVKRRKILQGEIMALKKQMGVNDCDNPIVVEDFSGNGGEKTKEVNGTLENSIRIEPEKILDTAKILDEIMDAFQGPEKHVLRTVMKKRSFEEYLRGSNMNGDDVRAQADYMRSQLDWFGQMGETVDAAASVIQEHRAELRRLLKSHKQ